MTDIPPPNEIRPIEPMLSIEKTEERLGLYTQSNLLLFESPPKEIIEQFQKVDTRVTYFHFRIPVFSKGSLDMSEQPDYEVPQESMVTYPLSDDQLEVFDEMNREGVPRNIYNFECVIHHLEQYIAEKYKGQSIAVRGTACSINTEPCVVNGKTITNPVQILQNGVENENTYAPMLGFDSDDPNIPFRTVQWLTQHPEELRKAALESGQGDLVSSIYPVLLVYDRTRFSPESTILPSDPAERAACILEAIVLDYPLSRQEFLTQV